MTAILHHKAFLCIWGLFLGITACGCCYLVEIRALIQCLPVFFPSDLPDQKEKLSSLPQESLSPVPHVWLLIKTVCPFSNVAINICLQ